MAAIILSPSLSAPEAELMLEAFVYSRVFYCNMNNEHGIATPESSLEFILRATGNKSPLSKGKGVDTLS